MLELNHMSTLFLFENDYLVRKRLGLSLLRPWKREYNGNVLVYARIIRARV